MKILAALLPFLCACLDDEPITVEDVIPRFDILTPAADRVADGKSKLDIIVCRTADDEVSKSLNATLKTTAGRWDLGDSDVKTATVPMSQPCEERLLEVPAELGTITTSATIDSYTRTLPITLGMAPVTQVRLARQGNLSSTASSMLTITANLDVPSGGKPTVTTLVAFDVEVQAPAGGMAWFNEPNARVQQGSSVQATLFVAQGVTQLTVKATAMPDGHDAKASDPLVIMQ